MMSLQFSRVKLKFGSEAARFRDLRTNVMKWMAAFSSFFIALGFRLI